MKSITVALDSHLSGSRTTLCTCVKATLTNGTIYGFTSHDQNITFDSSGGSPVELLTYQAGAYTASDVDTSAALNVDNLEVHGMLDSLTITEDDLHAGLWDHAAIQIFQVNYTDLSQGILHQRVGTLGEVSLDRNLFRAELRGLMQAYSRVIGDLTSPGCRAIFGDTKCKLPIETVTFPGVVLTVDTDNIWMDISESGGSPPEIHPSGYYDYGLLRFTSGLNIGIEMEIKTHHVTLDSPPVSQILLQLPMPYLIVPGDTFEAVKGCGKTIEHCIANNNILNFRGEPHMPLGDKIVQIARS